MRSVTQAPAIIGRVLSPAPRVVWDGIVADDPTSLADQSPAWSDAITTASPYLDASRLYEFVDGRRFVLPLVRRRGLPGVESSFPEGCGIGGLVGPDRDVGAIAAVMDDLCARHEVYTRVRPDPVDGALWAAAAPTGVVTRPRRAHVIDLGAGVGGLWDRLHKTTRRNVRHGQRAGLDITCDASPEHLDAYYGLFERSLVRWAERSREPRWLTLWRGRRRDPRAKLTAMADCLGDRFRLWMAWKDGVPAAGTIVLLGNTSHGTRGAMDVEAASPTRASHLVEWLAIEDAAAHGCDRHHLGETGTTASLARFKEGFGAQSFAYADYRFERLPVTRADETLRSGVKRVVGFQDA